MQRESRDFWSGAFASVTTHGNRMHIMQRHYSSLIGLWAVALLLPACAGDKDRYPSLAVRDVERSQTQFMPAAATNEPIRPVASSSDISTLVQQARTLHARFEAARQSTTRLVENAAGAGIESNSRQRAMIALADLSAIRGETAAPLGDLDLLQAEASTTFAPTQEIEDAQAVVAGIVREQDEALARLGRRLGQ